MSRRRKKGEEESAIAQKGNEIREFMARKSVTSETRFPSGLRNVILRRQQRKKKFIKLIGK